MPEPRRARLLRRLAAACYDLLVLAGVVTLTTFVLIVARGAPVPAGNHLYQGFLLSQAAAYFAGFWHRAGQTPGMRAWRLRVELTGGGPLTLATALKRFAAALLSAAPAGLGFLWALADPDGRAWHDRLSGTRVFVTDSPEA